jgi:hypothetical protein
LWSTATTAHLSAARLKAWRRIRTGLSRRSKILDGLIASRALLKGWMRPEPLLPLPLLRRCVEAVLLPPVQSRAESESWHRPVPSTAC